MKKLSIVLAMILVLSLFAGCGGTEESKAPESQAPASQAPASQAPASTAPDSGEVDYTKGDKLTLKVGNNVAPSHPETQALNYWAELINEKSGGRVTLEVYDSASLGDHNERQEGLLLGTIDVTVSNPGNMSVHVPWVGVADLPYLFNSKDHWKTCFDDEFIFNSINDAFMDAGFVFLGAADSGVRQFTNNVRPLNTPADLNGLKFRCQTSQISKDLVAAMGGNPEPLAFSELYMAMQQNVFDGQENPFANIYSSKFFEVQKYLSITEHQFSLSWYVLSLETYNKLSDVDKELVVSTAKEAIAEQNRIMGAEEDNYLEQLKAEGMEVNEVDKAAFAAACAPVRDEFIAANGDICQQIVDRIAELG